MMDMERVPTEIRWDVIGVLIDEYKIIHPYFKNERDVYILEKTTLSGMINSICNKVKELREKSNGTKILQRLINRKRELEQEIPNIKKWFPDDENEQRIHELLSAHRIAEIDFIILLLEEEGIVKLKREKQK